MAHTNANAFKHSRNKSLLWSSSDRRVSQPTFIHSSRQPTFIHSSLGVRHDGAYFCTLTVAARVVGSIISAVAVAARVTVVPEGVSATDSTVARSNVAARLVWWKTRHDGEKEHGASKGGSQRQKMRVRSRVLTSSTILFSCWNASPARVYGAQQQTAITRLQTPQCVCRCNFGTENHGLNPR